MSCYGRGQRPIGTVGRFEGKFTLQWIGPDLFNYLPDAADPFTFVCCHADGTVKERITPEATETDGGSAPRIAQTLHGYSPWEYGPAYMIHDWKFYAHDPAQLGTRPGFTKTFEGAKPTLAGTIWTLMLVGHAGLKKQPTKSAMNVRTIYSAVTLPFGKAICDAIPGG